MTANEFIAYLRTYRNRIPKHTLKALRNQALAGDVDGAILGLALYLKKKLISSQNA